jgi:hypothetical protein
MTTAIINAGKLIYPEDTSLTKPLEEANGNK